MTGTQLDRFFAEVIQQGAQALLPQHLPEEWLHALLQEVELWQQRKYHPEQKVPGLLAAVLAILDAQQGHPMRTLGSLSVSSTHLGQLHEPLCAVFGHRRGTTSLRRGLYLAYVGHHF